MIQTLSTMSGKMHKVYKSGKSVTSDVSAMTSMSKNESRVTYNYSVSEEPVISYNDMAYIPPCNSIVFRAGDSPVWNRNETALPMSWRLFKNTIINPGKEYTLQTIPTLSTAKDFDVKQNQPDFMKMFDKRLEQSAYAKTAMNYYQAAYGLSDSEIAKLDVDVYADDIMELISQMIHPEVDMAKREENVKAEEIAGVVENPTQELSKNAEEDKSVNIAMAEDPRIKKAVEGDKKIYANGTISRNDLYSNTGANHSLDAIISDIYHKNRNRFNQEPRYFKVDPVTSDLVSPDGVVFIYWPSGGDARKIAEAAKNANSRVMAGEGDVEAAARNDLKVTDAFYKFLTGFDSDWPFMSGRFSSLMAQAQANGNI